MDETVAPQDTRAYSATWEPGEAGTYDVVAVLKARGFDDELNRKSINAESDSSKFAVPTFSQIN